MAATANYHKTIMTSLREELGQGYMNYGYVNPDQNMEGLTLKQANDNFVEYIIKQLNIKEDSFVLDQGCGMGTYIVQISKRTGCRFIGTDIDSGYLEKARKRAEEQGVVDKARFINAVWGEMPEEIKKETFSHIITLGALYYGHPVLGAILRDIAACSDSSTQIFIQDYARVADWGDCGGFNRDQKLPHPLKSKEELFGQIAGSPLKLMKFEDITRNYLPGFLLFTDECKRRDPEMKMLTNPLSSAALKEGRVSSVIYYCSLE